MASGQHSLMTVPVGDATPVSVFRQFHDSGHDAIERERSGERIASLNHPNIAHIYGLEDSGGVRAIVMELVEGEDLAQRLTRGGIPPMWRDSRPAS
jgi:serine/threonine protein kinase